jgi:hypothetical protein
MQLDANMSSKWLNYAKIKLNDQIKKKLIITIHSDL